MNDWDADAIEQYVHQSGRVLADAINDGTDQHDYIQKLAELYEDLVGTLPEPEDEDDE